MLYHNLPSIEGELGVKQVNVSKLRDFRRRPAEASAVP
jgi:hypothetical protein